MCEISAISFNTKKVNVCTSFSIVQLLLLFPGSKSHSLGISFPHGMKKESRTVTFDNGRLEFTLAGKLKWAFLRKVCLLIPISYCQSFV
jgi:hypothetical protein